MDERLVEVFWFWKQVALVAAFRTVCAEKTIENHFYESFLWFTAEKNE